MVTLRWLRCIGVGVLLVAGMWLGVHELHTARAAAPTAQGGYIVLAWNDLGMHCYNNDFADLAVLPPYNNLHAQVLRVGDPPQVVTSGIAVTYVFTDNTTSANKSNFWDYADKLFGVKLAKDVGLKGKGLSGTMDLSGDQFVAEGIPLTEFSDSDPTHRQPFQLATVTVKDVATGKELARTVTVAPVSTEMHCDNCHAEREEGSTGSVATNILATHDEHNGTNLMSQRPVLCASCHSSNALGTPGKPNVLSLSNAMHSWHGGGGAGQDSSARRSVPQLFNVAYLGHQGEDDDKVPDTVEGCYTCHPGPQTRCLRDVMSVKKGMTCIDCHGGMLKVAQNPNPWLQEPRCDSPQCHASRVQQDQALFRMSTGHGGVACEGCHDSTHAIAPSREPRDGLKFIAWQGKAGSLGQCTTCHATQPSGTRIHASR